MAVTRSEPANRDQRQELLKKAVAVEIRLNQRVCANPREVELHENAGAWQGFEARPVNTPDDWRHRLFAQDDSLLLDFGEYLVGHVSIRISCADEAFHAPVRLKLEFGEIASELARPFDPFDGTLSRAWLQDATPDIDEDIEVHLPRRYAFRYLRIKVVAAALKFRIEQLSCMTGSAANRSCLREPRIVGDRAGELLEIWRRCTDTLAACMQTVFEDGPKRDRRLWMGDLHNQSRANYASFGNSDLVRRCLYLFAGLADDEGLVRGCVYDRPRPIRSTLRMLTLAMEFAPALLDYFQFSGDGNSTRELWPTALRQAELALESSDKDGLVRNRKGLWNFVDWCAELDTEASLHAMSIWSLRRTATLAAKLGFDAEASAYEQVLCDMIHAGRKRFYDKGSGLVVSGPQRQVSMLSVTWAVLSGMLDADEGREALQKAESLPSMIRPATPRTWAFALEAMLSCGMRERATEIMLDYWGGMLRCGADTFWEVYRPESPFFSPYGNHQLNSYCHGYSCGPIYLITDYLAEPEDKTRT